MPSIAEIEEYARDLGSLLAGAGNDPADPNSSFVRKQANRVAVVMAFGVLGFEAPSEVRRAFEIAFVEGLEGMQRALQVAHGPETER